MSRGGIPSRPVFPRGPDSTNREIFRFFLKLDNIGGFKHADNFQNYQIFCYYSPFLAKNIQ